MTLAIACALVPHGTLLQCLGNDSLWCGNEKRKKIKRTSETTQNNYQHFRVNNITKCLHTQALSIKSVDYCYENHRFIILDPIDSDALILHTDVWSLPFHETSHVSSLANVFVSVLIRMSEEEMICLRVNTSSECHLKVVG